MLIAVTARCLLLAEHVPPTRRGGVRTLDNPRRMHGRAPRSRPGEVPSGKGQVMMLNPEHARVALDATGTAEHARQVRKAAVASTVGTTIEWYDYFLYGTAAALV